MEADAALRAQYPELGTLEDFENWLAPLVREYQSSPQARAVSTIPIIFHIIHDNDAVGTGDNLSATYINAQLTQLNNDFRKILGTSGDNSNPVGADSELEFCMAVVDPSGNTLAEPGINRINRTTQGWSAPPYGTCNGGNFGDAYIENTIKPQSQWNPDNYLNVWVMDIACGILGYAQFPSNSGLGGLNTNGGASSTDGCVLLTTSVGSSTVPNPAGGVFNEGRTATHELGHFFGLRHIWGDANCGNDFCGDTPTQQGPSSGCPNTTTCDGVNDMVENYMDYSYDACMNVFSIDQKARMQTVMANSPRRGSLATSTACTGGPPTGGCSSTVSTFPYTEGFETNFGGWTNATGDNFDWARRSGGTPSSNTGPSSAAEGSFYAYVESSDPNYPSRTTILTSPCFDLTSATAATFTFQWHLYGAATMGGLSLEARASGGSWASVWSRTGNQGNSWQSSSVNLAAYLGGTVELRYVGTTGSTWQGDMAIDDISLTTGGSPPGCNDNELTLTIVLDQYGSETTWSLVGSSGTVASGGPYQDNTSGTIVTEDFCLPDGCYDFIINDAYGDGICCGYGNGSYDLSDDQGNTLASGGQFGSSETTNFCLPFSPGGGNCPAFDFNVNTVSSYGGTQDAGSVTVQDGGATILLANNAWKSISLNYTVTPNTVIEFDFRSTIQGEIHGIGFDNDNAISSNRTFKVHGTQNWGITTYDNYSPTAWTSYTIPVGASYTGAFNRLFFVADHDGGARNGNAYFRNVKVHEGNCGAREISVRQTFEGERVFKIYPNPTRDLLNLVFDEKEAGQVTLSVSDVTGRNISLETIQTQEGINEYRMDTQSFHPGSYILIVDGKSGRQTKQFVVIK